VTSRTFAVIAIVRWARLTMIGDTGLSTGRRRRRRRLVGSVLLDNLVQLPTIEPDPAASRAIIDLDSLPLGELKIDTAHWAEHALRPWVR